MSTASDKLRQMITAVPSQSEAIGTNINQIDDQVDEVTEEIDAITDGVCTPAEASAVDIIENTILVDKGGDNVDYGSDFGAINWDPRGNLTDWEITLLGVPVYTYNAGDYPDLDVLVTDFAFSVDYLTRPITDGASYGLQPHKANLEYAQSLLQENKNKVDASPAIFDKYATGGA